MRHQTGLMVRFRDTREEAAFEALYMSSRAGLLTWIIKRLASSGLECDPAELVQDTFVNIYRYAGSFRDEGRNTFRGWARTIAANVVRRARGRRGAHMSYQALPTGCLEPCDNVDGPHESLERDEQWESLARAWMLLLLHYAAAADGLSARDREALYLVEVEGRRYADVAARLRVKSSNMKMIVFRARKRIRSHMHQAFASANSRVTDEPASGGLQAAWRTREAVGE